MAIYIKADDVEIRLIGKVRFTDDLDDENRMPRALLKRLIDEAEGEVEHDLSPRYMTPFQTDAGGTFKELPDRPTRNIIRMLCELKAVERVLETDFGKGSAVNGEEYIKGIKARYDQVVGRLLEKKGENLGWKFPPLLSLRLNWFNTESDDGYSGLVLSDSQLGDGGYPARQINDPSENWWNGRYDNDG